MFSELEIKMGGIIPLTKTQYQCLCLIFVRLYSLASII